MRRFDSQTSFYLLAFATLALAVAVLPACNADGGGGDSGVDSGDSGDTGDTRPPDSGFFTSVVPSCVSASYAEAPLMKATGQCAAFELVGTFTLTNECSHPISFSNNYNPGEVIDSMPRAGTLPAGGSLPIRADANCSDGEVRGFLQLDITDSESGSSNTSTLNIPVVLKTVS